MNMKTNADSSIPGIDGRVNHPAHGMDNVIHLFLLLFLTLTACAEQPISQLDAALHALEEARSAGAEDYAIEVFTEAEQALFEAQEELRQQQDRFGLFRDYESASLLLTTAQNRAVQAKDEAIANREDAKTNALVALAFAKKNLNDVRALLAQPVLPLTDADHLLRLTSAFHDAETLLAETETIMKEENFVAVMTTAHSVESFATRIQEQLISARTFAKKRHV